MYMHTYNMYTSIPGYIAELNILDYCLATLVVEVYGYTPSHSHTQQQLLKLYPGTSPGFFYHNKLSY